ncbi:MAG: ribose 5-phosphate isomerase A, partial [Pseudomonadota bacterium]
MSAEMAERRMVAEAAAAMVEPSMVVGLGTGRTAALFIEALGERVREGALSLPPAVPTSKAAAQAGLSAGLAVADMMRADAPIRVDI